MSIEFPQKPTLALYIGKMVSEIIKHDLPDAQPWQWGIKLEDGTVIYNKDRRETFVPTDLAGERITTIIYSEADTTICFTGGLKWSLNPTQYVIADPHHGGEVYPQWPEELEEAGITSHPDEPVSDKPDDPEAWEEHRQATLREHHQRVQETAREWLKEEEKDA